MTTPHQRARGIVRRALDTVPISEHGVIPVGALEREVAAALEETIEACAKVVEDAPVGFWMEGTTDVIATTKANIASLVRQCKGAR